MSSTQLNFVVSGNTEERFFTCLKKSKDPKTILQIFGKQYHYFSLHQIHAFSGIFRIFNPEERNITTALSEVVYEELGEGNPNKAHSVILERFLSEVGVNCAELPINMIDVVDGVLKYIDELYAAFWGENRTVALATYCFLENSAVKTYPAIKTVLKNIGISLKGREFFEIHSLLEVEHAAVAQNLATTMITSPNEIECFNDQITKLNQIWKLFWEDMERISNA